MSARDLLLGASRISPLWAWGLGTVGQLGNNAATTRSSPVQVAPDKTWSTIVAGISQTAGVTSTKQLWIWGGGGGGALGDSTTVNKSSPTQVSSDKSWISVAVGNNIAKAVTTTNLS